MSDLHAEPIQPARLRLRSTFLAVLLLAGLLPSCQAQGIEPERSMDDALLLAMASHEQLEFHRPTGSSGGGGVFMVLASVVAGRRQNPHWDLASWYEDMALQLDDERGPMFDYAAEKIEEHNQLATELDKARERRANRGRGFQRVLRRMAQIPLGVGRAVGVGLRETFRFAKVVILLAADQVPRLARDYIQRKVLALGALIQGRIDLVWDRIADQVGWPFATWLRLRVDKAFIRHRNRLVARIRGSGDQAARPANAATQAAAAQLQAQLDAFDKAGAIVATCTYYDLADPARPDNDMDAIPFEIGLNLESETFAYRLEVQDTYEDYQKCDVAVVVEGGGVFVDSDEAWYQGEEKVTIVTTCYILNVETGEQYSAGPQPGGWTREIAGLIDPSLTTLYWCPAVQLGGINTMVQTGMQGVIASGLCQPCPIRAP